LILQIIVKPMPHIRIYPIFSNTLDRALQGLWYLVLFYKKDGDRYFISPPLLKQTQRTKFYPYKTNGCYGPTLWLHCANLLLDDSLLKTKIGF